SSRRRHTRCYRDWSSDVCSSDLGQKTGSSPPPNGSNEWIITREHLQTRGRNRDRWSHPCCLRLARRSLVLGQLRRDPAEGSLPPPLLNPAGTDSPACDNPPAFPHRG